MRRGAPGAHVYIVISAFPGAVRLPYLHRGSSQHLVHSSEPSSSQAGQQCTRLIVIHSVLISRENTARGLRLSRSCSFFLVSLSLRHAVTRAPRTTSAGHPFFAHTNPARSNGGPFSPSCIIRFAGRLSSTTSMC